MKTILLTIFALCALSSVRAQKTYTLESCLNTGLEHNYAIRISRNEAQISTNNVTRANAGAVPTIDLAAGYTGSLNGTSTLDNEDIHKKETGYFNHTLNAGLDLNWTVFDGFRIQTSYQRLQELQKLGEINTRLTIEDFVANLTAEYYNYVQQKIRLKNFLYAVSLSQERLRIVEARYRIGSFSRLDLQQARVDFNADSSKYINQQELVQTSRIRLNEIMANENVNEPFTIADTLVRINEELDWNVLYERMLKTNTALLQAARNKTLAELDLKTALSRNYPYLKFNAGYGYSLNRYGSGSTVRRHQWGPDAGLTLGITLFDGNRRRERQNARIQIDNALLSEQQIELSLKADLSNFWQAYQNNLKLLKLERENLGAAKENYTIAMERYLLGDLSGVEMREAQKSLLDAEERILTAEYNTKLCEISLQQISGGALGYLRE